MDVTLLSKLLQKKGWHMAGVQAEHQLYSHVFSQQIAHVVIPSRDTDYMPEGTLTALMRTAHHPHNNCHWTATLRHQSLVRVVLEKQSKQFWARIELPGLLIVTQGCHADCAMQSARTLLLHVISEEDETFLPHTDTIVFAPTYDTTALWDLFRQLKASNVASMIGIDSDEMSQFMSGKAHPCAELAQRLETSIHELGRQLQQISIR